jgi:hypothetical protein
MRAAIVLMGALGAAGALAAGDEPAPIAYTSVAAVLESLRADPTAELREQRGWIVVASREGAHPVEWFFTPEGHEAHPAVVKRTASELKGVGFIDLAALCQVEQAACDRLVGEFRQQHERDQAAAAPERVLLDVAIALDDHERMRVERMLVEEGLAAEIRFTDVLKLVLVPTLDEGRVLLWTAVYEFDGSDYVLLGEPKFASPGSGATTLELPSSAGPSFGFSLASLVARPTE